MKKKLVIFSGIWWIVFFGLSLVFKSIECFWLAYIGLMPGVIVLMKLKER